MSKRPITTEAAKKDTRIAIPVGVSGDSFEGDPAKLGSWKFIIGAIANGRE